MATMKHREKTLEGVVRSLLPQVDHICVYLNGYDAAPAWMLKERNVHCALSTDCGYRGSEAKFFWSDMGKFRGHDLPPLARSWFPEDVYLGVDDDIMYPTDYTVEMVNALDRLPNAAAVGVHGIRFRQPIEGYYKSMDVVAPFARGLSHDMKVHMLGTGTCAFRPQRFSPDYNGFFIPNMADLWFGIQALEAGRSLWAIARPERWLTPLRHAGYSVSLATSGGRDFAQTHIARSIHWPEP